MGREIRRVPPGLPPQVRGELSRVSRIASAVGLTPAGAGRTGRLLTLPSLFSAYPRRCGENVALAVSMIGAVGLPPQVRGEPSQPRRGRSCTRLTPAGAGRTCAASASPWGSRAYPRRCGENNNNLRNCYDGLGLPPQVRGEREGRAPDTEHAGLTPAGAGRTSRPRSRGRPARAYPRRCGENHRARDVGEGVMGLPPQVRGEPTASPASAQTTGLTPAGAGRTPPRIHRGKPSKAYPRRCGENSGTSDRLPPAHGLPPQVRGERQGRPDSLAAVRLTPAGAGRTGPSEPFGRR